MTWFTTLFISLNLLSTSISQPIFTQVGADTLSLSERETNDDIWKILLKVKSTYKDLIYIPQFTPEVKALDGKIITIKGYMYPLEEASKHEFFMLSYYPVNVCFFCGGSGPESVVEVSASKPIPYTSKPITLKGKLKLNSNDTNRLFFLLLSAEVEK
jgi:hypothetical protein